MSYYDDIYELAVDNHYLISSSEAADAGIPSIELAKLAKRGKLKNLSYGLYRLSRYVPQKNDAFAIAVAQVGQGAYLYGESVLALLELTSVNLSYILVATHKRVRRRLNKAVRVVVIKQDEPITYFDNIASQPVKEALRAASKSMMNDRILEAAKNAQKMGYLLSSEYKELREEFGWQ